MKVEKIINYTSIVITIVMFILAYGTLGSLELGNIDLRQATRRLLIFGLLMVFGIITAAMTKKEDI